MTQTEDLMNLLRDGRYHKTEEIRVAIGHSALRRLRDMRAKGIPIEKLQVGNDARYKLDIPIPPPVPQNPYLEIKPAARITIRRKYKNLTRLPRKPTVVHSEHISLEDLEKKRSQIRRLVFG